MKTLAAGVDLEAFFLRLQAAPSRVLLLDYDGTLAPFRMDRDRAVPYPTVVPVLRDLQRDGRTRLIVVSGRALDDLRHRLALDPALELWGTHGWERETPDGRVERGDPGAAILAALATAKELAEEILSPECVEVKPASVAGHVRGIRVADAEQLLRRVRSAWDPIVQPGKLESRAFDGGIELRVSGRDKGYVVRQILSEEPVDAAVAYLGDDLTDEDAFRALDGRGLSVLVRGELRATAAHLWIRPPEELVDFLRRWRKQLAALAPAPSVPS